LILFIKKAAQGDRAARSIRNEALKIKNGDFSGFGVHTFTRVSMIPPERVKPAAPDDLIKSIKCLTVILPYSSPPTVIGQNEYHSYSVRTSSRSVFLNSNNDINEFL